MSLASAQASETRRQAATTVGYYNLKLGPTTWRFGATLGTEYNSNVRNEEDGVGDFIFRPGMDLHLLWPVTDRNALNLDLTAGYSFYATQTDLSRYYIEPGSGFSFDVFVGDVTINFHDRFSVQQDSYTDPTLAGQGNYSQFENTLGASALWDLNDIKLRAGYDHLTYTTIWGDGGRPDGASEIFFASVGAAVADSSILGVDFGAGMMSYDETEPNVTDGTQVNAGAFYEAPLTEYIAFRGTAGYTVYQPDPTDATNNLAEDFSGVYAQLALRHRVNQYLEYTLSGGRTITFAYYGGTVDLWTARWQGTWRVMQQINISSSIEYEHGTELFQGGEVFDRVGLRLSAGRQITQKLGASLAYQIYWRESDLPGRDYVVQTIGLDLRYAF
jgi:hypothetical protein